MLPEAISSCSLTTKSYIGPISRFVFPRRSHETFLPLEIVRALKLDSGVLTLRLCYECLMQATAPGDMRAPWGTLFYDVAGSGSGTACGTKLKVNEERPRAPTQQTRIRGAAEEASP